MARRVCACRGRLSVFGVWSSAALGPHFSRVVCVFFFRRFQTNKRLRSRRDQSCDGEGSAIAHEKHTQYGGFTGQ
jgi:hypothetical protein